MAEFVSFYDQLQAYRAKLDTLSSGQIALRYQKSEIFGCVMSMLDEVVTEYGFFDINDAAERCLSDGVDAATREKSRVCRYWRDSALSVIDFHLSNLTSPLANQTQINAFTDALLKKILPLNLPLQLDV